MRTHYSTKQAELNRYPVLLPAEENEDLPRVALDRAVCVVGARVLVHLPLQSQQISKAQALIVQDAEGVYLRDLASRNQTFVNERAVCEAWLRPNDSVQFGRLRYRCASGFDARGKPPPFPQAELYLEPDGLASRRTLSIANYTFLIGSRDGCDLKISGPQVALAHAVLFVCGGRRFLRDLSSGTGTLVNDQAIREVELRDGDQIRIGMTQMEYHPAPVALHRAAAPASAPAPVIAEVFDLAPQADPSAETIQLFDGASLARRAARVNLPWNGDSLEQEETADGGILVHH